MGTDLAKLSDSLQMDADGVIRIGKSRVTLNTLAAVFFSGDTPEQIVVDFPTLDLADVYSAIGCLLRNREAVDAYLRAAEASTAAFESAHPEMFPQGVREKLLARRAASKAV
jgi:uncharacterized protein (DUF433 family)